MLKVFGVTAVTGGSLALACYYAKSKISEAFAVVEARVTSLETSNRDLLKANDEAREAFRQLEEDKAAVERRLSSVEKEKAAVDRRFTSLVGDKKSLERRLTTLEGNKNALERRIASVEASKKDLERHITSQLKENEALKQRLTALEADKNVLERRITSVEALERRLTSVEKKTEVDQEVVGALGVHVPSLEEKSQTQGVPVASIEAKNEVTQKKNQPLEKKEDGMSEEPEMPASKLKSRRWETMDSTALLVGAQKKKNHGPEKKEEKTNKEPEMTTNQQETRRGGKVDPKGLFVGAIPRDVSEAELAEYFEKKFGGRVEEVRIKRGKKKYDYGFMFFEDRRIVQRILRHSDPIRLPSHEEGQNLFVVELRQDTSSMPTANPQRRP